MARLINLIGQKFGRLTVICRGPDYIQPSGNKKVQWICECECIDPKTQQHTRTLVRGENLRSGHTQSCGCLMKERTRETCIKDEVGNKYGHLTVLEQATKPITNNSFHVFWKCQCDCPNQTIIIVDGTKLRNGHTQSCGCLAQSRGENAIETLLKENNIKYEKEKRFKNLGQQRFDFYVNNEYLIEYDGIQHFQITGGWGTKENLKKVREHDQDKNNFCKLNNIPLIRIPYTHLKELKLKDLVLETTKYRVI